MEFKFRFLVIEVSVLYRQSIKVHFLKLNYLLKVIISFIIALIALIKITFIHLFAGVSKTDESPISIDFLNFNSLSDTGNDVFVISQKEKKKTIDISYFRNSLW